MNFLVAKEQTWPEIGRDYDADIRELARNPRGSVGAWLIRPYLELKRIGADVNLSQESAPGCINVTDAFSLGRRKRLNSHFIVVARSDGPMPALANFIIHQNGLVPPGDRSANMAHWPQPGLLPRDPSRGSAITRVTFKGEPWNLDIRFRQPAFIAALGEMGISLDLPEGNREANASKWADYSNCDAVIAARNLTHQDARIKPASKLINAWIAGTPALLGPEPAFRELRESDLDYIEITKPEAALAGLRRLREDPQRYDAMIQNGFRRAEAFSADRMVENWKALLEGPVQDEFRRWERTSLGLRLMRLIGMHSQVGKSRRMHLENIETGPRILDTVQDPG